jgi:capsular polysaccharide transport system ATP-binding protein
MIRFVNLNKSFTLDGVTKTLIRNANLTIPTGVSVGLLGRNGAGKSTLLRMISGSTAPTSGRIEVTGSVSWPVGFSGSFHPDLSGAQNVRFVARVYGVDTDELADYVAATSELGHHYHLPVRTYSSGMRSRPAFRRFSKEIFLDRLRNAGAIVVSHSMSVIRELCSQAIVLDRGEFLVFDSVDDGIRHHEWLLGA